MPDAKTVLDHQYLEMRWRVLSLAADLDRIQRAEGGLRSLKDDPRLLKLSMALELFLSPTWTANRAEQVQMILSDLTPAPK